MDLKSYKQVLCIENNIVESGRLTFESLLSICEYRPWIFKAIAEYFEVPPSELKGFFSVFSISSDIYFYVLTKQRVLIEPRVGLFCGQVIYD